MGRFQENPDGTGKSPHICHLRPQHRSMARSVALGARTPTELADTYGYTTGQISRIMGSPLFQAEVSRLSRELDVVSMDIAKDLQIMGETSLRNLDEDLNLLPETHEPRKLRNQTSIEVLGMLGISKNKGTNIGINILNLNNKDDYQEVNEMSEQELRTDVMELIKGVDGSYA